MARLADRYTVLAPDLRGFGDSDKPIGPFGPDQHATDMLALLNALGLSKAWAHRKNAFDDVLETFTDNFLKPGNLAGGFAHYRASHEGRVRMIKGEAP